MRRKRGFQAVVSGSLYRDDGALFKCSILEAIHENMEFLSVSYLWKPYFKISPLEIETRFSSHLLPCVLFAEMMKNF